MKIDGPHNHRGPDQPERHLMVGSPQRPDVAQQHRHTHHDGQAGAVPGEDRSLCREPGVRRSRRGRSRGSLGPEGGDHHRDRTDDHDADGEDQWHPRTREGVTPAHRPLVGAPLPKALGGDDGAQCDKREPQEPAPPFHWSLGRSCVAATPVAISARAVRFQARNVRSLA